MSQNEKVVRMSTTLLTQVRYIIQNDLSPLLTSVDVISKYLGLCLILYGIVRLMRHAHHNMMHRVSPIGTIFSFLSGAVLISYTPEISALAGSLLGTPPHLMDTCPGGSIQQADGAMFCPILGYLSNLPLSNPPSNGVILKTLAFAVLFLYGVVAFIRGFVGLVKAGEGGGSGNTLSKCIVLILTGAIGINAEAFYNLMQGLITNVK